MTATSSKPSTETTLPAGQYAGVGGEEADRDRALARREDQVVRHRPPERGLDRDVVQLDAGREADEVGHLPRGDPRRGLDDVDIPGSDDQLHEGDAVDQPEGAHGVTRDVVRTLEHLRLQRGRIQMDPSDPEAGPRGPQAIRKRDQVRLAVADDEQRVQLGPIDELLEDRARRRRERKRLVDVPLEVVERANQVQPALPSGVGRLQHGGRRDRVEGGVELAVRREHHCARLRHACVTESRAHRRLVGHRTRDVDADAGQRERFRDRSCRDHRAVARDRQHAVDAVHRGRGDDLRDVREVDVDGDVGDLEADRVWVAVDGDDPVPDPLRVADGGHL